MTAAAGMTFAEAVELDEAKAFRDCLDKLDSKHKLDKSDNACFAARMKDCK